MSEAWGFNLGVTLPAAPGTGGFECAASLFGWERDERR
jgi:hypothetical protein